MLFIPLLKKLSQNENLFLKIIPLIIPVVMLFIFQEQYYKVSTLSRHIATYSFFVYIGLLLKDVYKVEFFKKLPYCVGIAIVAFATMYFISDLCNLTLNMQKNKFPPNLVFLFYNLGALAIVFLFCNQINNCLKKISELKFIGEIFNTYKDYCYTCYLYHPFAFLIVSNFITYFDLKPKQTPLLSTIILWSILVILTALIAKIFARFETIGKKRSINSK